MALVEPSELPVEQRARIAKVFKFVGASDVVLGFIVAALGPPVLDADPTLTIILIAMGGLLAVIGLAVYWSGRRRFSGAADAANAPAVVRTRR